MPKDVTSSGKRYDGTKAESEASIVIAVGNDTQFSRLCSTIDLPGLIEDPHFSTNAARAQNRSELNGIIEEKLSAFGAQEVIIMLEKAGIPSVKINDLADVFHDPQTLIG